MSTTPDRFEISKETGGCGRWPSSLETGWTLPVNSQSCAYWPEVNIQVKIKKSFVSAAPFSFQYEHKQKKNTHISFIWPLFHADQPELTLMIFRRPPSEAQTQYDKEAEGVFTPRVTSCLLVLRIHLQNHIYFRNRWDFLFHSRGFKNTHWRDEEGPRDESRNLEGRVQRNNELFRVNDGKCVPVRSPWPENSPHSR